MSTAKEIRAWLGDELAHAGPKRRAQLAKLAEHLHRAEKHQHANALPVGSFQRQIARIHERKMVAEAMHLGFHPPEEEIKELGLHLAGRSLGLSL
ncbi:hypothetical protein [Thiomonas sp.]